MRNIKNLTLIAGAILSMGAMASTPVTTLIPVDHVFSPKGFDSNDTTEIIVSGFLPNLCHKAPESKVEIVGRKINVTLTALKYELDNPFCPEVVVPFFEAVKVGLLDKGNYDIVVNGKTMYERKSEIFINEASSDAVDEYIYANVDYIEKTEGSRVVSLKGYNPSDCFELEGVQLVSNGADAYSILPKMKQVSDFCPMKMVAFNYKVAIPTELKADRILLHVRSMDGKSVNSIFSNVPLR
jgi:hypothetical protein